MKRLLCVIGLLASAARSDEAPLVFISTAELSAKVASDARSKDMFALLHIKGAINVPATKAQTLLPKRIRDRHSPVIFYCNGPKCTKSQKAGRVALALGYTSVLEYNEGLPAWGKATQPTEGTPLPAFEPVGRSPDDVARELEKGDAGPFLLDIRDAPEFIAFHARGAVNVPLDDIASRARELPRKRTIVLMDHTGHQSLVAARQLHRLGFDKVQVVEGGVLAWQQKILPMVIASTGQGR